MPANNGLVSIETRGFSGGAREIQNLANQIAASNGPPEIFIGAAQKTVVVQQRLAPFRTGFLRANIGFTFMRGQLQFFSRARYSMFVENGTFKMPARPFFFPPIFTVFPDELRRGWDAWLKKAQSNMRKGANSKP